MSNHYHMLVRVGATPLSKLMAPLLGGYAGYYNRRHQRAGYVFQNRHKSILVDEESYLLELIRYIHLNPMRVAMLLVLEELDKYPWTGHAGLTLSEIASRLKISHQAARKWIKQGRAYCESKKANIDDLAP